MKLGTFTIGKVFYHICLNDKGHLELSTDSDGKFYAIWIFPHYIQLCAYDCALSHLLNIKAADLQFITSAANERAEIAERKLENLRDALREIME